MRASERHPRAQCRRGVRFRLVLAAVATLLAAPAIAGAPVEPFGEAVERYRAFMINDIDQALAGARELRDRTDAHDVTGARQAWIVARVGWERSEVFTSGFVPELDAAIDAWPDASSGFHGIEAKLFGSDPFAVVAETDVLIGHLAELGSEVRGMKLTAQGLLNGVVRLAYEVGDSKVDGGESRFSGTSIDDMRNNVDGIELAYQTLFAPALATADPHLAEQAQGQINRLRLLLMAPNLKAIDADALRQASETLIVTLQAAGPKLDLGSPTLEEPAK